MSLLLLTSFALFSRCYANAVLQPSPVAADPTITPGPKIPTELLLRQNDDRFMGWIQWNGQWTSRQCEVGGTLFQTEDFWRCCATTAAGSECEIPVGCVSGSLIYDLGTFASGSATRGTFAWYVNFAIPTSNHRNWERILYTGLRQMLTGLI
jgi:hypothetical protein